MIVSRLAVIHHQGQIRFAGVHQQLKQLALDLRVHCNSLNCCKLAVSARLSKSELPMAFMQHAVSNSDRHSLKEDDLSVQRHSSSSQHQLGCISQELHIFAASIFVLASDDRRHQRSLDINRQ